MSDLSSVLQELFVFLEKQGKTPPTHVVRLVEIALPGAVDARGRPRVRRDDFREPSDYETRFDELMKAGLPWINVSCYGVDDRALIVAIEVPARTSKRAHRTSVNYSGPAGSVLDRDWRVEDVLVIE